MKGHICNGCKAQIRGDAPAYCPICGRHNFSLKTLPDKTPVDDESAKVYEDVVKKLEEYDEGCEPEDHRYSTGE